MKLQYRAVLNQGNEAFGAGQSISVEEVPRGTISNHDLAVHMHEKKKYIDVDLAEMVLDMRAEVEMHFIAQGFAVPTFYKGKQLSRSYADVKLKKNIPAADALASNPEVTALTKENISQFVNPADLVIRYKVETEELGNSWLRKEIEEQGIERLEASEKPFLARVNGQGGNGGNQGNNGGNNPDDGTLG